MPQIQIQEIGGEARLPLSGGLPVSWSDLCAACHCGALSVAPESSPLLAENEGFAGTATRGKPERGGVARGRGAVEAKRRGEGVLDVVSAKSRIGAANTGSACARVAGAVWFVGD